MLSTASVPCQANVTKSSSKLGITIPHFSQSSPAREVVRLTVATQTGQSSFLALAAPWITIPTSICTKLNIAYDQTILILELKPIQPHDRPPFRTEGEKVDMLSLIPSTSTNGDQLYVDEYKNNGEPWLRIWYYHPRGAARQVELKRYVDISKLGQLLGQLQAEGDKQLNWVAFKNVSLFEHSDFVSSLRELGVAFNANARCTFNPNKSSYQKTCEYSEAYAKATGIQISSSDRMDGMKGAIAAYTFVRSTILAQILFFAMDEVRSGRIQHELLRRNFLAKLMSGDGTLDARMRVRRLDVRLQIVDRNIGYLNDYGALLCAEGFKPKILTERITVRTYCTWLNLLKLYKMGAFKNGRNWIKLLCSIIIEAKGTQNRGYLRIQELSTSSTITSDTISDRYRIGRRAANLWIRNMGKLGLMEKISVSPGRNLISYAVTKLGKETCELLKDVERDYHEITVQKNETDPLTILQRIKERSFKPKVTERSSPNEVSARGLQNRATLSNESGLADPSPAKSRVETSIQPYFGQKGRIGAFRAK